MFEQWAQPCINQYRQNFINFNTQTNSLNNFTVKDNQISFDVTSQNNSYNLILSIFEDQRIRMFIKNTHQQDPLFDLDDLLGDIKLPPYETKILQQNSTKSTEFRIGQLEIVVNQEDSLEILFKCEGKSIISLLPYFIENRSAVIIRYHQSPHLSGIPSHCDSLLLRDTMNDRPYQLYNCDRYLWSVNSRASMYGSNPQLFNFGSFGQNVLFWRNTSETYIDIHSLNKDVQREVMIVSEVNDLDLFLTFNFNENVKQLYYKLQPIIGKAFLPTLWSLAHQHSRYSFMSRDDILAVDNGYDQHKIPIDAFYLDLHHLGEGMKYFTWNEKTYPNPETLLSHFDDKNRQIVTIQDPHVKVEEGYHIYDQFAEQNLLVQRDGKDFIGKAWPGDSVYVDFVDQDAQRLWAKQYDYQNYMNSNKISVWNDLNEPTVQDYESDIFCMPKDCTHQLKVQTGDKIKLNHRQVRLCYGMLQAKATQEGLNQRDKGELRNITFTRSFYTGVQQYAIVWTADAESTFKYLCATTPLLLSYSMVGMSFNGGDIPGFQYKPAEDLCQRWYQLGAFQPFFRSHSNFDTERREPWLFSSDTLKNIRQSVHYRYELLPFWYTQFFYNHQSGMPVLRPLWMNFSKLPELYQEQQIHMIGDGLIVVPVISRNQKWFSFQLLNLLDQPIFDYWNGLQVIKQKLLKILPDRIRVFVLGGTIIPCFCIKNLDYRHSFDLQQKSQYHLKIYVNHQGSAQGQLFIDDGITYRYQKGLYILLQIVFKDGNLDIKRIQGEVTQEMIVSPIYNKTIEQITVCYPNKQPLILQSLKLSTLKIEQNINLF